MTNHMQDIAKMLGVELGEEFEINDGENHIYYFDESGLCCSEYSINCEYVLFQLLSGGYSIKYKPWKPKHNEIYFYVYSDGVVTDLEWHNCEWDFANYKLGNCYRTAQEAETNRDKWKAFYASDEVLEV